MPRTGILSVIVVHKRKRPAAMVKSLTNPAPARVAGVTTASSQRTGRAVEVEPNSGVKERVEVCQPVGSRRSQGNGRPAGEEQARGPLAAKAPIHAPALSLLRKLKADSQDRFKRLFATCLLTLLLISHLLVCSAAFAQTKVAPTNNSQGSSGSQQPQGAARQTQDTVPNPYADAIGENDTVTQASNVNTAYMGPQSPRDPMAPNMGTVDRILSGERTNVVFQAAEQGEGASVQRLANNVLNASLGSVNESYRGLHKWFQDDIIGNLFSNIGQLIGKWISEIINGWIADAVQFLARFLRVFVLNPNIAVNGLDGSQNDGISPYIRQGADVMYGIAVDLLLLLFILCIWKYWAEASWRGAGNLMGPIGRLIFTAGLLIAWPTIYAFEVQISNEMIKAIYFDSNDQVAMLHYALAAAVKGGVIAAGAAAMSVFAPILGNLAFGAAGPMVGGVFYFASMVVFLILGGILIAELVYILVLKAIQTALLTAQYMFAPIFLVFFATPDTENIASGYVRAFVETSLWTFVWVGLLKVMVIIMFSNFNPWGKILIAVGVLQLMIQVPAFLARAQISPMSDFVSAGLVTGGILKAMGGLGGIVSGGISTLIGQSVSRKQAEDLYGAKDVATNGIGGPAGDQKHLESLNKASEVGRNYDWSKDNPNTPGGPGTPGAPGTPGSPVPPPVKTPAGGATPASVASAMAGLRTPGAVGPVPSGMPDPDAAVPGGKPGSPVTPGSTPGGVGTPGTPGGTGSGAGPGMTPPGKPVAKPGTGALAGAAVAAGAGAVLAGGAAAAGAQPKDEYSWSKSTAEGWDEKNLINVDTRKLVGKLTSVDGVGIRHGQEETSILGSARGGIQRINIAKGAEGPELSRAIYAAAFADNVASDPPATDAARKAAAEKKSWQPQGFKQGLIANWLEASGKSWYSTPFAKENFNRAMFAAAVEGSQAYVSNQPGNAYTEYLRGRYGEWDEKQDASAIHLITNPESSESPWNRNIGPATDGLIRAGIPIGMDTRGAMQNMTIQGMHPARQKKAVMAVLSYSYDKAKELFGTDDPAALSLGHGELARSMPAHMVNEAVAIYEASGSQADLRPSYGGYVSGVSATTRQDLSTSYQALAIAAPAVARGIGRLRANVDPRSISTIADLEANIVPAAGETHAQAFATVMETTSNGLANGEMHGIPMKVAMNRDVGRGIFEFMGADIADTNSPSAHRKMRIISQNLRVTGTPNDSATYTAIETVMLNGGQLLNSADDINMARTLMEQGCQPDVLPGAVRMAVTGGYHLSSQPVPINTVVEAAALEAGGMQMNTQKVRLVGKLQDAGISRDLMGAAVEVAVKGGYAGQASLPAAEIAAVAEKFASGAVSDTKFVPAAAVMVKSGVGNQINNQSLRIVAEACADLGGYQSANEQYVKAVLRVAGGLQNPNIAPSVLETYVRANGERAGITGADSLPLGDVLNQLGPGFDISKAPVQIAGIQRDGAFSAYQMQDPIAVNLAIEHQGGGPRAMQAVNVVTRLVGSQEAADNPPYIEVAQEYLGSGGKVRDFDSGALQAAVEFAAVREAAMAADGGVTLTADVMQHLRITPGILRSVARDMGNNGMKMSPAMWDRLVAEAVRRAATPGGPGGTP